MGVGQSVCPGLANVFFNVTFDVAFGRRFLKLSETRKHIFVYSVFFVAASLVNIEGM